jgi:DNA-binding IclR family transcriptional regulator
MAEDTIRAVDRALDVLLAFSSRDSALTLTEIARRTDLNKSTVLRLLGTLESRRFIVRLGTGNYRLGPSLARLGGVFRETLQPDEQVVPALQRLAQVTGESSAYFVKEGDARRCQFRVDSQHAVRDQLRVGDTVPLGSGSYGRILIQFAPLGNRVPTAAPVVVSVGERDAQMASIAAPVFGADQALIGAIGISMPVFRFDEAQLPATVPVLLREAIELTELLGGDTSYLDQIRGNGWQLFRGKPSADTAPSA